MYLGIGDALGVSTIKGLLENPTLSWTFACHMSFPLTMPLQTLFKS